MSCRDSSRFLYSDEIHIGPETVMTTLYTAKKYAVPALEGHCVEFLTKHLRADNAFMLLTQVGGPSEHRLSSVCRPDIVWDGYLYLSCGCGDEEDREMHSSFQELDLHIKRL